MFKHLQRMLLIAALCLTWAAQAQTTCQLKIVGEDSYEDGWNGGTLTIAQGGQTVSTYTLSDGSLDSTLVTVSSGSPVSFSWSVGSYDDEVTIRIYDGSGVMVYSVNDPSSGALFTLTVPCPTCIAPTGLAATVTNSDVDISWNAGSATEWDVVWGVGPIDPDTVVYNTAYVTTNSYSFSNLDDGQYRAYVRAICDNDHSAWVGVSFNIGVTVMNMATSGTNTLTTCNAIIYDDGGPSGSYSSSCSSTLIIQPSDASHWVSISGSSYTEGSWDYLTIYDGIGTTGEVLWSDYDISMNQTFGPFSSSAITVEFISDVSVTYSGFQINVTCIDAPDCDRPLTITADYVTEDSVYLQWVDSNGSEWLVVYGPTGFTPGDTNSNYESFYETIGAIGGLMANTIYDFYVMTLCSNGDTSTSRMVTARTLAGAPISEFPYLCGFEIDMDNDINQAADWVLENGSEANYWMVGTAASNGGSRSMYITSNGTAHTYNTGSTSYVFAYATFVFEAGEYAYSYDWIANGESSFDFIRAAIVPSSTDITAGSYCGFNNTSGVPTGGIAIDGGARLNLSSTWNSRTGTFNIANSGTYKMVFMWRNDPSSGTMPPAAIDNVQIVRNTCPAPTALHTTNVTSDSITVTWTAGGDESSWIVTLSDGTSAEVYNNSYSFDNLLPNTNYTVTVRAICSSDDSSMLTTLVVRTDCGSITTLPFVEDFENQATGSSSTGSAFIPCWTRLNNGTSYGGYPYLSSTSSYNHTQGGTKGLYWYASTTTGTYGDYYYIILPEVDTNVYPMNNLQLSFWAKSSSTSYYPVFQVGIMNSNTDTNFHLISTINVGNNTEWTEFVTTTSDFTGNGSFIAIRGLRPSSAWYAYMDDITLDIVPPCARVVELSAPYVTLDTITVAWNDTSSNTMWYVEYDTVEFVPGNGTVIAEQLTDTFFVISGLDSATQYHIYVYPACGDYVGYRHIAVSTLAASPATVPYMCNFEGEGPNGWDFLNDGQANYWMVGTATNNGGNQSLYITNNGSSNAYNTSSISYSYAIRTLNLSEAGEYAYSYDWKGQGESHNYDFSRIFVVPASEMFTAGTILGGSTYAFASATPPASWIELTQSGATPNTLSQASTWQSVTGTFNIATPGNYKIVIAWANDASGGTNPPTAIDNVALQKNECSMVQNVVASLTADSISLSWTPGDEESEWVVTLNGTPTTVYSNNYTFTGLNPNTSYIVTIRAVCGNGDTSLTYSETYHTPCTAMQVPYTENFDNLTTGTATSSLTVMPSCWDYILTGSSSYQTASYYPGVYYSSSYSHSGNYCLRLYGVGYFMLPPFTTPLDSLQLTFWDYTTSTSYGLEVGVMEGNTFVPVQIVTTPSSTHQEVQVFFGSYTGNSRIIAFRNYYTTSTTTGYSYHYIDNINVDYIPSCPHVTNLTSTGNTATTVTLDWIENGNATQWEVGMSTSATAAPSSNVSANAHPYTVNGLVAGFTYYFWVRPICGNGDTGLWEGPLMCSPGSWNMRANMTDTLHMCGGIIYDDGGPSGDYSMSQTSYIILYPDAPNNLVNISGNVAIEGNSYDNLFVYDGVGTSGTQLVALAGTSYSSGTTINATSTSGPLTIYFVTDGSVAYSGFALNVSCITTTCMVTNLNIDQNVTPTSSSLALTWDAVTGSTGYQVEYGTPGFVIGTGTPLNTNNNHIVIGGLNAMSNYEVYVRSICQGGDTGSWTHNIFSTPMCDNVTEITSWDSTMSETTTSYGPIGYCLYDYSYVQTLIDSAQFAELTSPINAFAFKPTNTTSSNYYTHMTVWMANVPESSLSAGAIVPNESHIFVPVLVDADLSFTNTDWQLHSFDTTFTWDGHSNVLFAVKRDHGSWASSGDFAAHSTTDVRTRYYYQDDTPISHTSPSASSSGTGSYVGDLKFFSCEGGCSAPHILSTTNLTYQSATVNWSGNAASYEVAVKAINAPTWPAETAVNGNHYDVSGLTPSTTYQFRVRSVCDVAEGLISDWRVGTFTTDSLPCFSPSDVELVAATVNSATIRWTANGNENSWRIHVWNTAFDQTYDVSSNPATVIGLSQNVTYNATVSALCGGIVESDPSDTIVFTTATCQPATNVTVTNVTGFTAVVNWNGTANSYNIEYGPLGFGAGDGTTINGITNTTYTITDLEPEMQYDVYVYANCNGQLSVASGVVHFTTTSGIANVDGSNISIYPNPTTSATVVSLTGINGDVTLTIVDMNGRTVLSETMSCEGDCTKRLEVDGLAQGTYFVRISGEGINAVKKLVVK